MSDPISTSTTSATSSTNVWLDPPQKPPVSTTKPEALLDAAWAPTTSLGAKGVRTMLESYGVGIDCAGYAQQAAMKAVGLDPSKPADRVKFGFAPFIGNESMAGVPTSPKFTKVAPED